MNKDYYKPYEGRDIKILDQHAANTIAEDHLTFPYQLLDHLAGHHLAGGCRPDPRRRSEAAPGGAGHRAP